MKKSLFIKMMDKLHEKIVSDKDEYRKYKDIEDSDFDEPSKTKQLEGKSTYKQIMEM